ncbi:amidase [Jiangella rhizosphaerae]|uniref:Amidase n=2 Tax=Jiangella rhizosphaerae TaxID=2293569 RepID=A0A418KLY3_9ACTN|nr:amidase [Jiangella rhizosphaerae]
MAVLSAGAAAAGAIGLPQVAFAGPATARSRTGPHPDAYTSPRPEAVADPTELTIAEAAYLLRAGTLRPEALLEAYLARIAAYDDVYQAFNLVLTEQAAAAARSLRRGHYHGPLHGIPLAIKDNYYTAGVPTTANSYVFADFVPPFDATTVAKLTAAGGIVLGKTQMGPLATTRATTPDGVVTTVNAWTPENPSTNPGGSSTGTATAVAGRLATSGIGTQTGGSITAPSNAQNLTGLKPTMGRASLYGIVPLTYSRDHPGPLARDAKDAAIMLAAMAGEDANDPRTQGLPPVPDLVAAATPVYRGSRVRLRWPTRIGVIPGFLSGTSPTAAARRAFLDTLAGVEGVTVVDVTLPEEWDLLTGRFNDVRLPERAEPFVPYLRQDLRLFGVSLTSWLQGALMGADEYVTGQRAKLVLLDRVLNDLFEQCDVVVQTSPVPFDIIGLPELALPIGFSGGLPIGTILGGRPYAEDRLLAVAAAYQALTDWHWRRPSDPVSAAGAGRARAQAAAGVRPRLTAAEAAEQSQ